MKSGQKGAWPWSRDLLLNFRPLLKSVERLKIQNSNLACGLKVRDTKLKKNQKLATRGRGLGHVTYILNFGTILISLERLKIQTSNFAIRLMVRDTKPSNEKWPGEGVALVTWPTFQILGPPLISLEWLKIQTSNFACRLTVRDTKPQNEKLAKRRLGPGHVTCYVSWNCWIYKPEILYTDWM